MLNGFKRNIESLITRLGRPATLRKYTNSGTAYNPVRTPIDSNIIVAVFDYEAKDTFGSTIQKDDKLILVASSYAVTKQDKIVDEGKEYNVVEVETVAPGSVKLYYRVQGRL